jgi:DNA-directed RNA polymerase specialized sigma24 family protein
MSPASLRRYRAERLLREQFDALRAGVLASVRCRLRACGAELDDSDLDACYAQAWQGLYTVTLEGEQVLDPPAWLALATFRRAIDEHRGARRRQALAEMQHQGVQTRQRVACGAPCAEHDAAGELDRRLQLRQLFEALRLRLSARERRAFALCYLQGLSRAEAAAAMGLSERRMRKLMDGRRAGAAGASAKLSALVHTIREERWCQEQGSLMRGLAYGVLDPQGERHRLALMHANACPACRSYVVSLRGLAAALPPVPGLLSLLAAASDAARHVAGGARGAATAGGRTSGALAAPASAASGAAGAGAAGGGWVLLGGGAGAKLAAGCLLALGLGAGCAALGVPGSSPRRHPRQQLRAAPTSARGGDRAVALTHPPRPQTAAEPAASSTVVRSAAPQATLTPAARASREFGPEQAAATEGSTGAVSSTPRAAASRSSAAAGEFASAQPSGRRRSAPAKAPAPSVETETSSQPAAGEGAAGAGGEGGPVQAQREFSPG